MNERSTWAWKTVLHCLIFFLPGLAFGQAGIVSEREKIVSYSAEDLNPAKPGYEWEGATLLKDIRVIDGLGNRPETGQDLLIADGKIHAIGKSGSLDFPADAKVVQGASLKEMHSVISAKASVLNIFNK